MSALIELRKLLEVAIARRPNNILVGFLAAVDQAICERRVGKRVELRQFLFALGI